MAQTAKQRERVAKMLLDEAVLDMAQAPHRQMSAGDAMSQNLKVSEVPHA